MLFWNGDCFHAFVVSTTIIRFFQSNLNGYVEEFELIDSFSLNFVSGAKRNPVSGNLEYLIQMKGEITPKVITSAFHFRVPIILYLQSKIEWHDNGTSQRDDRRNDVVVAGTPKKVLCEYFGIDWQGNTQFDDINHIHLTHFRCFVCFFGWINVHFPDGRTRRSYDFGSRNSHHWASSTRFGLFTRAHRMKSKQNKIKPNKTNIKLKLLCLHVQRFNVCNDSINKWLNRMENICFICS